MGYPTRVQLIGPQADDWPADYRLFARDKWDADDLFVPVVRGALHMLPDNAPLVTALDDTSLRETGRKIPGVGCRRDPMSPPFTSTWCPGNGARGSSENHSRRT